MIFFSLKLVKINVVPWEIWAFLILKHWTSVFIENCDWNVVWYREIETWNDPVWFTSHLQKYLGCFQDSFWSYMVHRFLVEYFPMFILIFLFWLFNFLGFRIFFHLSFEKNKKWSLTSQTLCCYSVMLQGRK